MSDCLGRLNAVSARATTETLVGFLPQVIAFLLVQGPIAQMAHILAQPARPKVILLSFLFFDLLWSNFRRWN